GKYLDSQFLVSGEIDQSDPAKPQVDLTGIINLELSNLNKLMEKTYPGIKASSPLGQLDTQFSLSGSVRDFKNCYLQAKSTSSNFSLYGLKATDLSLDYLQELGIAKIPALQMAFYDGVIEGSGALSLNTTEFAYRLELRASGIKLEKLILDTPSKQKNISGIFLGEVKLNGAGSDLNKIDGAGSFAVSQGRLGDLNLLQGLGKLLLAKDLGNIEFTGCTCDFLLKNKFVNTDNFKLTSSIVNLTGPIKIGFDSSLEGALDVEILSELVPLSGTFKDVTTAIIGKGGIFGVIKLSGTLSQPKFAFKTAVVNIIQGLADMLFKK
ncbi:MAG: AsmA family protein, partial [Candidatus Omnitrophota bacterium]